MVGPGDPEEGFSNLNDSRTVPLAVVAHSTLLLVARGGYFEVTLDLLLNSIPFFILYSSKQNFPLLLGAI